MTGFFIFIVVIVAVAFFIRGRVSYWIEWIGEILVIKKLLQLNETHYKILNNLLLLSSGRLDFTQIDHVVVSNYGIFCVEIKSYRGWIFGNAKEEYWTQIIFWYMKRFYNPLRQNYVYTKALEALIKPKYPQAQIYSLVVFLGANKLEISGTDSVIFAGDLIKKIESYTNAILSDIEKNEIYEILDGVNIQSKEMRKLHDHDVMQLKDESRYPRR